MSDALDRVPVFPLPNVVLFPGVVLPLHIFEPRYRVMVKDALAARAEIAIALLKPGWEGNYPGTPPVYEIGCLGSLENIRPLPDGRYLLNCVGLSRVRFDSWLQMTPYRLARCVPLPERGPARNSAESRDMAIQLSLTFQVLLRELSGSSAPLLVEESPSLESIVNRICFSLDIPSEEKQLLLQEDNLTARARVAGEHLDRLVCALATSPDNAGTEIN